MGIEIPIHETNPPNDTDRVIEIGPGKDPMRWPKKNPKRWCDLYIDVLERHQLKYIDENNLNYSKGSVEDLSFIDNKSFDYVYARQILEHTISPARACDELSRIAKRGYIATPTIFGEYYFGKPINYHRWLVIERGGNLCFFEKLPYEDRPFNGWYVDAVYHPKNSTHEEIRQQFLSDLKKENCVHLLEFNWQDKINYFVFYGNGRVETNLTRLS